MHTMNEDDDEMADLTETTTSSQILQNAITSAMKLVFE